MIYWDGYGLDRPYSGVAQHARGLLSSLRAKKLEITIVGHQRCKELYPEARHLNPALDGLLTRNLCKIKAIWPNIVWQAIRKDSHHGDGPLVIHGLSNVNLPLVPTRRRCLRVITIHDLIPALAPDSVSPSYHWQFKMLMPLVLGRADVIVCVSHWTQRTIELQYPQFASKIHVIPNGVPTLRSQSPIYKGSARCRMISVSRFEKYKNLGLLLDILRAGGRDYLLNLVTDDAGQKWARAQAPDLIEYGLLRLWTNLSEKELDKLYRGADVYVHPSMYEGFGLPIVEAISNGLPAVCMAGSGPDDFADQYICRTISSDATTREWLEAIASVTDLRRMPSFTTALRDFHSTLPTWNQAAESLQKLYNGS